MTPVCYTWRLQVHSHDININTNQAIYDSVSTANNISIQLDKSVSRSMMISSQQLVGWVRMMGLLFHLVQDQINNQVIPRLQVLHIKEGVLGRFDIQLPQMPQLNTLTTLQIDMNADWDIIHLFTILSACPNLIKLLIKPSLDATSTSPPNINLAPQLSNVTNDQENAIIRGPDAISTMPQLRICSLYNLHFTLPALSAFIQASPELRKLVLARCSLIVRQGQEPALAESISNRPNQGVSIINLVGAYCLDIVSFHLSMTRGGSYGLESQEVVSIVDTFPKLKVFNFAAQEFRPNLFKAFSMGVVNNITTLNILPVGPQTSSTPGIPLRQILCTFVHLIHLRAPTAVYFHEDMDLNGVKEQLRDRMHRLDKRSGQSDPRIPTDDPVKARQYIWVCRGLKTLHMTIDISGSDTGSPVTSLIIFGFLSRMCPLLQELHLKRWDLNLKLHGGLCLLARLQRLERIRIMTNFYSPMDEDALLWIHPGPPPIWHCLLYPLLRHQIVQKLKKHYKGNFSPTGEATTGSKLVERGRELEMDLSKIGYPEDLLEWMDARHLHPKETMRTQPNLDLLWIECAEQGGEDSVEGLKVLVRKTRPFLDFELYKEPMDDFYYTTLQQF
ncbi:hypothetical protein BGZ95_007550 [Linnemannia exigua]|uniref:Uncharacterized protein n=1 Tax=Linnemannia exigua TaxID=604196 RepID=A0AAD4DF58_9FUNG|nr:hypothetical protein BGZ95_007550 [Linnemannia exigua]